tara:strand:+ start:7510 stop:7818 length:309 start_codon:yes stop_codon:yes gene_type:complete
MSIYKDLPNDIIIRIIKEADGGLSTHKKKMKETISIIERCRISADETIIEDYLSGGTSSMNKVYKWDDPSCVLFEYNGWMFEFWESLYEFQGELEEAWRGEF